MKAEYYDHVTIFCSDIMGFTTITSKSTPIQVRREREREKEREKERERERGREKIHDTKKWLLYSNSHTFVSYFQVFNMSIFLRAFHQQ